MMHGQKNIKICLHNFHSGDPMMALERQDM